MYSNKRHITQILNDINQLHNDVSQIKRHDTAYLSKLYDELHKKQMNIYDIIKYACSSVHFSTKDDTPNIASGSFITLDKNDLQYGLFMTAAHYVMKVDGTNILTVNEVYVTNPITGDYTKVSLDKIYYDGVADVALLRTDIDFSEYSSYPLKLSTNTPQTGDVCFICGNPYGFDNISFAKGVVRDSRFYDNGGLQIPESLTVDVSTLNGIGGGPIVNIVGEIIGIISLRMGETFGYGVNLSVLKATLPVLKTQAITGSSNKRNTSKYYLGLSYNSSDISFSPFVLAQHYGNDTFPNKGVYISHVTPDISPFDGVLETDDILLSATIDNKEYNFGDLVDQYSPGIMIYKTVNPNIIITYLDASNSYKEKTASITLVTYASLGTSKDYLDAPRQGAA